MKANKKILALSLVCVAISMSGCSAFKKKEFELQKQQFVDKTYNMEAPSDREVYEELAKAANNMDRSLQVLANVNNAAKSETMTYDQIRQARWKKTYVPLGLERSITIRDWNGPVTPVFNQIEKITNYKVKVLNEAPPNGNYISVNAVNEPVINVIRSIDADMQDRIRINILEDEKIIEVSYVK